jgi:competence protein ComEA
MPTPAERKALVFLGAVAVLGAGVRGWRLATVAAHPVPGESLAALDAQIAAVDSARVRDSTRRAGRKGKGRKASSRRRISAGAAEGSPPPPAGEALVPATPPVSGGPVPLFGDEGRASAGRARAVRRSGLAGAPDQAPNTGVPVDVDRATAAELERLPRVGRVLAARIVADREARGAFGSVEALTRVTGVGPALAKRLAPLVTFSGTPRPSSAAPGGGSNRNPRRDQHIRRDRHPP